jgi:2-dehydro-3-deoxyphosphogluconate aldolase/(4S)-4-hydroxy-2-oxoglutarate aldolase
MNINQVIEQAKVVPVAKIADAGDALKLADALYAGGLPLIEVTYRTSAASQAISEIRNKRPDMIVGAGTILTVDQAQAAMDSGASFLVSPGFNEEVVTYALKKGVPIFPGVNNPTHVELALRHGLNIVKFFPAEVSGGTGMLKALGSVYEMKFMPTGGINQENILSYLSLGNVIACGGSWMVAPSLITSGNFSEIQRLTEEVVLLVKGAL